MAIKGRVQKLIFVSLIFLSLLALTSSNSAQGVEPTSVNCSSALKPPVLDRVSARGGNGKSIFEVQALFLNVTVDELVVAIMKMEPTKLFPGCHCEGKQWLDQDHKGFRLLNFALHEKIKRFGEDLDFEFSDTEFGAQFDITMGIGLRVAIRLESHDEGVLYRENWDSGTAGIIIRGLVRASRTDREHQLRQGAENIISFVSGARNEKRQGGR